MNPRRMRTAGLAALLAVAVAAGILTWARSRPGRDLMPVLREAVRSGSGRGRLEGERLTTSAMPFEGIPLNPRLPDAWSLHLEIERLEGLGSFNLGWSHGNSRVMVVLDAGSTHRCGLDLLDGRSFQENGRAHGAPLFPPGRRVRLRLDSRGGTFTLRSEEAEILSWQGPADRLSLFPRWNGAWTLLVASFGSPFRIHSASIEDGPAP